MTFLSAIEAAQLFGAVGLFGFVFHMAGFAALQFKMLEGQGLTYSALNVLAAFLVLVRRMGSFSQVSALTQVGLIPIGGTGILSKTDGLRSTSHRRLWPFSQPIGAVGL